VRQLGAAGGVEISASHNPAEWNGIKLFHRDGRVLNAAEGGRVRAIFEGRQFAVRAWDRIGKPIPYGDPHAAHLMRVLQVVNAGAIRERGYHVVLDANHGVGGILGARLLTALGCRVTTLGGAPDGAFEHPPEPLPENLGSLCRTVRENQADIGFAQDPDADRLAIVDQTGRPIGEELTITLAAAHVLSRTPGIAVVNLSTTRAVAEVAAANRSTCERTPVGEANVVERMIKRRAVLGGEGNGGVILPQVVPVRDSFSGMALILEAMAVQDTSISELVRRLPQYVMLKEKITVNLAKLPAVLRRLAARHRRTKPNTTDGLRLDWPDRWVHVRPSNTEPIARIIAEARSAEAAHELVAEVRRSLAPALVREKKPSSPAGMRRSASGGRRRRTPAAARRRRK
jgi:phosphomannomutase